MAELKNCTTNFFSELCGVNVVIDPQGQLGTDDDRILIVGQKATVALAANDTVHQVRDDTRTALFGANSMLNLMIDELRLSNPTAELYAYVVPNAGTFGRTKVTFNGLTVTDQPGTASLWVNGRIHQVEFNPASDTNATLANKFASLIAAGNPTLNTSVAAGSGTGFDLNITTDILGEIGGFLDVRLQYDVRPDIATSTQISVTKTDIPATGLPNLAGLAALTQGFEFVANPYTDDASLTALSTYLCGQWSGGVNSRAYGVAYGTEAALTVVGQNANNALISFMGIDGALTPSFLETASYAGIAYRGMNCASPDIAASLTGQRMPNMRAPEIADRFSNAEKAALVEAGIGYFNVDRIDQVAVGRSVTTYTVADDGTLDLALRDVNKPAMLACISRFLRENMTARFTGYSFRRDGVVGRNSDRVATPAAISNYMISLLQELSNRNLIQDIDAAIASLDVTPDPDTGCLGITSSPTLVEQLCCTTILLRTF